MSTVNKLAIDTVVSQILVEEQSCKATQSALLDRGPTLKSKGKPKEKSKEKSATKDKKGRKKCEHCGNLHGGKCWKKAAENAKNTGSRSSSTEKDKGKKSKEKTDLTARVANISLPDMTSLQLFIAHQPLASSRSPFNWIVDSGTSTNMTCECSWFMTFHPLVPPQPMTVGDGRSISATGIGRICLDVNIGDGETRETILQDVYYIPKLDGNLLSVS